MMNKEYDKHLAGILYETFRISPHKVHSLYDYYKCSTKIDISNLKIETTKKSQESLKWAIDHPDYNFNSILKTPYSNALLLKWFKIKYEHNLYVLKNFEKGRFILTASDVLHDTSL